MQQQTWLIVTELRLPCEVWDAWGVSGAGISSLSSSNAWSSTGNGPANLEFLIQRFKNIMTVTNRHKSVTQNAGPRSWGSHGRSASAQLSSLEVLEGSVATQRFAAQLAVGFLGDAKARCWEGMPTISSVYVGCTSCKSWPFLMPANTDEYGPFWCLSASTASKACPNGNPRLVHLARHQCAKVPPAFWTAWEMWKWTGNCDCLASTNHWHKGPPKWR